MNARPVATLFLPRPLAVALLLAGPGIAQIQLTERVSVASSGAQGDDSSLHEEAVSADGRFVAFQSDATNLVAADTNGVRDIFVRDRSLGSTTRVSVSSSSQQANGQSFRPSISADGRWVAFESNASNLVTGDTNNASDVFLHDRATGTTTRRSVSSFGLQGNGISYSPALSADGQWLCFGSFATTLVGAASNAAGHVFLHECATGITTLVSSPLIGIIENGQSGAPSVSADGRYIAFESSSSNLTATTSFYTNIFVRDRILGVTLLASPTVPGTIADGSSEFASISADGRTVAFQSNSSHLIVGDTNLRTDVFVRDLALGVTERVSVTSTGAQSTGGSDATSQPPGISSDGRFVAFTSWAMDLAPGAIGTQVYLRDRVLGTTTLATVATGGIAANNTSTQPALSADGRFLVFQSLADNLVAGDTNGTFDMFVRGPFVTTWTNLGSGLAGISGVPNLLGAGTMVAGSPVRIQLASAYPSTLGGLFVSFQSTPIPFLCGTLVAYPDPLFFLFGTDAAGTFALDWPAWPAGLSGLTLYLQAGVLDPAAICGASLSNGLLGLVP